MTPDKRIYYLDTVIGILLIHMIAGHCCQWSETFLIYQKWTFWLDFFMPCFFFKAGIFFKQRPLRDELNKSFRRLIIPYIYFSVIGTVILLIKLGLNCQLTFKSFLLTFKSIALEGATAGNLPLWFLLSLFAVRISFSYLHGKLTSSPKPFARFLSGCGLFLLCIVYIPVYYLLELKGLQYPLWLSNISSGMLFFTIGYYLRDINLNKTCTLILASGYILVMIFYPTTADMRTGSLTQGEFLLWAPTAVMGILSFISTFRHFFPKKNLLSVLGSQTMPYYCMHWCVLVIVSFFFVVLPGIPNIPFLIALIISNIIILPAATCLIEKSRFSYIIK